MDLVTNSHPIRVLKSISPSSSIEGASSLSSHTNSSDPSFPIIAIAIIGILATAFLLVSYYMFAIKCCINWHRIDIITRFSVSRRRPNNDSLLVHSPGIEARGLDEAVIRSIPIFQFKTGGNKSRDFGERSFCECAVCLNEFQDEERLKIIPNCSHVFHIDCIDIWLQNNANCPLCRTSVSSTCPFPFEQIVAPSPTPQDPSPFTDAIISGDEDYVVIELTGTGSDNQRSSRRQETVQPSQGESSSAQCPDIGPSPRKLDQRVPPKKHRKYLKMTSLGDEVIDIRNKDDQFSIQPIRRSISMDSSADRQLYLAVQDSLRQNRHATEVVSPAEGCSGRVRRTFFPFGHGRTSKNAIQPVCMEP